MNKAVWKWLIPIEAEFTLGIPKDAEFLAVQIQFAGKMHETPTLWALVDPDAPHELRRFRIVGTGFTEVSDDLNYVGTFQLTTKRYFVGHLFERQPNDD